MTANREFPPGVDEPPSEASRREFLKLLGASLALAGLAGCTRAPREKIVPYVSTPPEVVPGIAAHYATAMTVDGYATGLLVESHEGRPTKIEGNPNHPSSLGSSGSLEQASLLSLYDPARARGLRSRAAPKSWDALVEEFAFGSKTVSRSGHGKGLHVLMEPVSSPTTLAELDRLTLGYPDASVHFYTPLARGAAWNGARMAFGQPLETHVDLAVADLVVALDADILASGPNWLRHSRDFAARRRVRSTSDTMNRLYVVEGALTVTGGMADHRLRVRRSDVESIAAALFAEVAASAPANIAPLTSKLRTSGEHSNWVRALAKDLLDHPGRSAVIAGDGQPALVHALAGLINASLGNVGKTVFYAQSVIRDAGGPNHGLEELARALDADAVDTLLILGGNPVYTAPADVDLGRRIRLARECVYLAAYENETAAVATWFVPEAHYLESWGDTRAPSGTASIVQPLIEPLYAGRTRDELLATFSGVPKPTAYGLVREQWQRRTKEDFEIFLESALHAGVVGGTEEPRLPVTPDWDAVARALGAFTPAPQGLELSYPADSRVRDGAFTNNAWLLELPDPITKLTWENALLVSPKTAAQLGIETEDLVDVALRDRRVTAPVFVSKGHADDTVSLSLGYGRRGAEVLANGIGVDASALRTSAAPSFDVGVVLTRRAGKHPLASTQAHWSMEGRDVARRATLDEYRATPLFAKRPNTPTASLYKLPLTGKQQWGMSIDLNACTGCSACVIACQAENNSPIVGKEGVLMHREMHWMRIDRYFAGSEDAPKVSVEPMLCQHCEKAPCEYVCPVNATVHSPDGLNEQVYNRCVGTRFCSNNCAWKVRRFNWFNYHELAVRHGGENARALHDMAMNPDVTVRARGVMEKCTYCVQRIRENEISSKISGVPFADGDVVTACAQACPARAIVFGSLTVAGAEVKRLRTNDRDYAVLDELGTEPRTRYLARLDNPNPDMPT